ncbi:hypothetical protein JAO29_12680 [Edaphobacter sp. HDX4]|uniref:hypothetical protein n=1 Tax=Edaphobacter sp. HDX4 TaxID=2794064 RepID=UPI002FE5BD3F
MNRYRIVFAALIAFFLAPLAAPAQIALYAGFSGAPLSGTTTNWAFGPLFGAYKQTGYAANIVSIGGDVRASFLSRDNFHFYTGAAGPRVAFKLPVLPFRPYVEGLVGVGNLETDGRNSSNHFNYQVLGGLDTTLLPHLDWRVLEFDYSAASSQSFNAKILTTGLVLRLW